jgi:hypothetical protein
MVDVVSPPSSYLNRTTKGEIKTYTHTYLAYIIGQFYLHSPSFVILPRTLVTFLPQSYRRKFLAKLVNKRDTLTQINNFY